MRAWLLLLLLGCEADEVVTPTPLEVCNGADDDGDGAVDEGLRAAWYADADGDGFGAGYAVESCTRAAGWVAAGGDCDDGDPARAPGLPERCNGLDDDCDGERDEGVLARWYADADGDGWGAADAPIDACAAPAGSVAEPGDCDDGDATAFPGSPETCDGVDQDCDGTVDEGVGTTFHPDADGDGYGAATGVAACELPEGYTRDASDCDDGEASANPAGTEVCNTWVDEDCDGTSGDCPLGGALSLADADATLTVENDSVRGVASGDLDGDGYADLVVGRPSWRANTYVGDDPAYVEGAVSVLYGAAGPEVVPYGEAAVEVEPDLDLSSGVLDVPTRLGRTVVVTDVDGDGVDDVLAGAPGWDPVGQVMVASGRVTGWSFAIRGDDADGQLGSALAVGDTDGDGTTDVLVGETGLYASVYLLAGPISADVEAADVAVAEWIVDRPTVHACDADGDGLSDVLLRESSTFYVSLAPHAGMLEAEDIGLTLDGASGGLACADLDADGYADLLVGAPDDGSAGTGAGAVFRVPGPVTSSLDVTTHDALLGELAGDMLGASLALVGDVDGDGVDDLAVGAPGADGAGGSEGAVYLVASPYAGTVDLADAVRFGGAEAYAAAGSGVGAAGDTNDDGYADLVVVGGFFGTALQLIYGRGL